MTSSRYWTAFLSKSRRPTLDRDVNVDAAVIGGGLMGVTAAYLLTKAGHKVALVDRERIGTGDTGNTTAHLTAVTDLSRAEAASTFGDDGARLLWDAGDAAIAQISDIVNTLGIECDFKRVPGYLHLPNSSENPDDMSILEKDAQAAARLDIPAALVRQVPFFGTPGIRFPNQGRFHPGKYIARLVEELDRMGCLLFEDSNATEFCEDGRTIRAGRGTIRASKTVIATHSPIMGHAGMIGATLLQTKLYLYTSYAMAAEIPKGAIPDCLYWDTQDPYNYLRLQPRKETDLAIYGGLDHKTGQIEDTEGVYTVLQGRLERLLEAHGIRGSIEYRWSGQVIETNDGAPFIGETAENQFAATGFAGNGMTFGTLAGMMATDWALGKKNPWSELLDPSRKKIAGGTLDYVKENLDYPYYMVRDRLRKAEGTSVDDVRPGEGMILKIDGERLAVYRSDAGTVTRLSPVCTHLGCVVSWNEAEKSWDCPCHGSRFHPGGEVMSGPAETPLERK